MNTLTAANQEPAVVDHSEIKKRKMLWSHTLIYCIRPARVNIE
jgi:hypothetical protein